MINEQAAIDSIKKYCESLTEYKRFKTREVNVGGIPLGGDNPIRIQSMTTTDTMDLKGTVEQTIRMVNAGCEYVRITAPSLSHAHHLQEIKDELRKRGYDVPLVADIHFTPNAAEVAARIVEKVRVNPGNYADKKRFEDKAYTDDEYKAELDRIRNRFAPLVRICKEEGTAMRIGTNHGSLSDRIMGRYGDTPLGMVESALEFVRICRDEDYHEIVLSMKASNPQIMVQAYRLLVNKMIEEGMNYPLHLGVTEAGDGEDGRIKSAVGIGTLLEDGLGDTIRVSLTEEPEAEAPVAIALAERYKNREGHKFIIPIEESPTNPFEYTKRETFEVAGMGGDNVPKVFTDFGKKRIAEYSDFYPFGYFYSKTLDKWNMNDFACDFIFLGKKEPPFKLPNSLKGVYDYEHWINIVDERKGVPYFNSMAQLLNAEARSSVVDFVKLTIEDLDTDEFAKTANDPKVVFVLAADNKHGMAEQRRVFFELMKRGVKNPVIIKRDYKNLDGDKLRLYAATDIGALMIDGFGDGVWIETQDLETTLDPSEAVNRTIFGILQATRTRISKTEYIACPSCGRTLFDLVEVTNMIRAKTSHLKGVKIGIMGCIVNGPGEMADADYGYVGSGPNKITLYRGKEVVKKNIPADSALDELIEIIRDDGNWIDPPKEENEFSVS